MVDKIKDPIDDIITSYIKVLKEVDAPFNETINYGDMEGKDMTMTDKERRLFLESELDKDAIIDPLNDNDEVTVDEAFAVTDWPDVIELDEPPEIIDEMVSKPKRKLKVKVKKERKGYRISIPRYPLDHRFKCSNCGARGKIAFNEEFCPSCNTFLINPADVE